MCRSQFIQQQLCRSPWKQHLTTKSPEDTSQCENTSALNRIKHMLVNGIKPAECDDGTIHLTKAHYGQPVSKEQLKVSGEQSATRNRKTTIPNYRRPLRAGRRRHCNSHCYSHAHRSDPRETTQTLTRSRDRQFQGRCSNATFLHLFFSPMQTAVLYYSA